MMMHPRFQLLQIAAAALPALVLSSPLSSTHVLPRQSGITWGACEFQVGSGYDCANLTVPLDYTDPKSNQTLTLQLLRVPAVKTPKQGSILVNFGGPGIDGRTQMNSTGTLLQAISGGYFDLISFDPRGTGNTLPFSCYATDLDRSIATLSNSPAFGHASDITPGRLWAYGEIFAEACAAQASEIGGLLGTAFVARDIIQVVDALGGDKMARFWGFSYGTALGATLAAMFPDRIERLILDGVLNPHQYYHGYDVQMYADTDKVFSGFIRGCQANPHACALARPNMTAQQVEASVYALLHDLKYNPIPFLGSLIDYSAAKSLIASAMYGPISWPGLAALINGVMVGNLSVLEDPALMPAANDVENEALQGIKCGDKFVHATKRADIQPALDKLSAESKILGDQLPMVINQCAQWTMPAKERYSGDFRVKTNSPVLVISNTYDPYTPLKSGRNLTADLEGSALLQQRGYGHTSLAQPSICTAKAVQAYFMNGTLPANGTICEVDVPLFSNLTWADIIPRLEGTGTGSAAKMRREELAVDISRLFKRW